MDQNEKLRSLLSHKDLDVQHQGIALFESFDLETQLEVGFEHCLSSLFESIRTKGLELIEALSDADQTRCWDAIFGGIEVGEDGTPNAPIGWVWNAGLLEAFLMRSGKELRGLRVSTICRRDNGLGDLSWLRHCPNLTHLDLDTVFIDAHGLKQLVNIASLQHLELALCQLTVDDLTALRRAKPNATILTTADKVGFVFQYDADGRGIRIAAALYPQFRNGKLVGILGNTRGYAGGGCQGHWSGGAVVTDDSIHWGWGHWTDTPNMFQRIHFGDEPSVSDEVLRSIDFNGYLPIVDEREECNVGTSPVIPSSFSTMAIAELDEILSDYVAYDEDRDWEDLQSGIREKVVAAGGFLCTRATCTPGLLLAGISGGLLTSWPSENIDLPLARQALAPGLPSFTKMGGVPEYRMLIVVALDYDWVEDIGYAEAFSACEEQVVPHLESLGFKHVASIPEEKFSEQLIVAMSAPKSIVEFDGQLLALSDELEVYMTVYDFEGSVSQGYNFGSYDTGTIGLVSGDIRMYNESTKRMLETYKTHFDKASG